MQVVGQLQQWRNLNEASSQLYPWRQSAGRRGSKIAKNLYRCGLLAANCPYEGWLIGGLWMRALPGLTLNTLTELANSPRSAPVGTKLSSSSSIFGGMDLRASCSGPARRRCQLPTSSQQRSRLCDRATLEVEYVWSCGLTSLLLSKIFSLFIALYLFLFYTLYCILCFTHCLYVRLIRVILKDESINQSIK